jgi:hypothetical protein
LLIGVIAVCAQLAFEFHRNIKFRNLLLSVPIGLQESETEG